MDVSRIEPGGVLIILTAAEARELLNDLKRAEAWDEVNCNELVFVPVERLSAPEQPERAMWYRNIATIAGAGGITMSAEW